MLRLMPPFPYQAMQPAGNGDRTAVGHKCIRHIQSHDSITKIYSLAL